MLTQSQIVLDTTVSFDLYPVALLGTGIKNAKVLSIVSAATANALGFDTIATHAAVYPTLPAGVPDAHDGYHYLQLRTSNGDITYVGLPWIKESTYAVQTIRNVRFSLENVTPENQEHAIQSLSAIGLRVAKVEIY